MLTKPVVMGILNNVLIDWVWRSLVACLNGVQEAGGSSPLTQTNKKPVSYRLFCFSADPQGYG